MAKKGPVPPSFSLITAGKVSLLLKKEYQELLLQQGIEDLEGFLERRQPAARHLAGRTAHPCVPIGSDQWMVVRRYSHGGLFRTLTRDLFLLGARSFQELALIEQIRAAGIPTIQPIGAVHCDVFPFFYRAYLLSLEIPAARDLVRYLQETGPCPAKEALRAKRKTIRAAGLLLRQFHQAGFFHADLQLKNILVAGDRVFLIDFDRSCRKESLPASQKVKNLLRLNRSAQKWVDRGLGVTRTDRWRFFQAYAQGDRDIRRALRSGLRFHSLRFFFRRLGWRLTGSRPPSPG